MLGLFDSGVGGLTVVKELLHRAPNASFVYLGDTARVPYGNKSADTITRYALEDTAFLVSKGATAVAVACNTVSSVAMEALRHAFPQVRFFDVVEPAVGAALAMVAKRRSAHPRIGVIGTRATIQSDIYRRKLTERAAAMQVEGLSVVSQACPLFVPLVEEGWLDHPVTRLTAEEYLKSVLVEDVDTLVLGCTHYPLIKPLLQQVCGDEMTIVDSAVTTAEATARRLSELGLLNPQREMPNYHYYVTDIPLRFQSIGERFLGRSIRQLEMVRLGS